MSTSDLERRNIAVTMRKSVENLVISSQDAIGQSISQALTFSGVVTQQLHHKPDARSVSRSRSQSPSPSPSRSPTPAPSASPSPSLRRADSCSADNLDNDKTSESLVSATASAGDAVSMSGVSGGSDVSALKPDNPKTSSNLGCKSSGEIVGGGIRTKKKSWYNALYPTYKSKCEDFRRLFKDLPDDERLIVDYSCALQKDILVHGRLYASQNYLCFYASIFGWETNVTIRWTDVTAITKEKMALVIPNAILVCTEGEKNFITSFSGRDKAYLMLFRIWQNALMDQPRSTQEIWAWVHSCYGEELGFNSDDEEYTKDSVDEAPLLALTAPPPAVAPVAIPYECAFEEVVEWSSMETSGGSEARLSHSAHGRDASPTPTPVPASAPSINYAERAVTNGVGAMRVTRVVRAVEREGALPTDMSDTSDSEHDTKNSEWRRGAVGGGDREQRYRCAEVHAHSWRPVLDQQFPFPIDQLFTMLFTSSRFNVELLAARLIRDYSETPWQAQPGGAKTRQVTYTQAITHAVGPKEVTITESQVVNSCSRAGALYSINSSGQNSGVPYADYFTVEVHYCMTALDAERTHLAMYGTLNYKKSIWGMVKSFIEKNIFEGIIEFTKLITTRMQCEVENAAPAKKAGRRRRRTHNAQETPKAAAVAVGSVGVTAVSATVAAAATGAVRGAGHGVCRGIWPSGVLALLLLLNALLYWKLYHADTAHNYHYDAFTNRMSTLSVSQKEDWSKLLEEHSLQQRSQLLAWRDALDRAVSHLAQTEKVMLKLLESIKPSVEQAHASDTGHAGEAHQGTAAEPRN